jgi:hypothetical protein
MSRIRTSRVHYSVLDVVGLGVGIGPTYSNGARSSATLKANEHIVGVFRCDRTDGRIRGCAVQCVGCVEITRESADLSQFDGRAILEATQGRRNAARTAPGSVAHPGLTGNDPNLDWIDRQVQIALTICDADDVAIGA